MEQTGYLYTLMVTGAGMTSPILMVFEDKKNGINDYRND
jgi:hypothetical protein